MLGRQALDLGPAEGRDLPDLMLSKMFTERKLGAETQLAFGARLGGSRLRRRGFDARGPRFVLRALGTGPQVVDALEGGAGLAEVGLEVGVEERGFADLGRLATDVARVLAEAVAAIVEG